MPERISTVRVIALLSCALVGAGALVQGPSLESRVKTLEDRVLALELKLEPAPAHVWTQRQVNKLFFAIGELTRGAASPAALHKKYGYNVPEPLNNAQRDLEQAAEMAMKAERKLVANEPKAAADMAGRALSIHDRIAKLVGAEPFDLSK